MTLDERLFFAINGLAKQSQPLDHLFLLLSSRSTLYLPGALAIGWWIWAYRREAVLGGPLLAASVGLSDFLGGQLKWFFERVRPCRALSQAISVEPGGCGGLFSFPSNHAINTAAAAAFIQVLYPRAGWIAWPIVALVGLARVYVGAHYVTDVLGGWMIGGAIGGGVAFLLLKWPAFRKKPLAGIPRTMTDAETKPS